MAVPPVANEVDDDVLLELGPPLRSELAHEDNSLWIIAVHVEDGRLNGHGHVSAVWGGAGKAGVGGEANLVVDNEVDHSTGGVVGESCKSERLIHHTLSSKGSVTVKKEGDLQVEEEEKKTKIVGVVPTLSQQK